MAKILEVDDKTFETLRDAERVELDPDCEDDDLKVYEVDGKARKTGKALFFVKTPEGFYRQVLILVDKTTIPIDPDQLWG